MDVIILNLVYCSFNVVQPANPSLNQIKTTRLLKRNKTLQNLWVVVIPDGSSCLPTKYISCMQKCLLLDSHSQLRAASVSSCSDSVSVCLFFSANPSLFARALHDATWNLRGRCAGAHVCVFVRACMCVCVRSYYPTVSDCLSVTLGALDRWFPVLAPCWHSGHDLLILLQLDVLI